MIDVKSFTSMMHDNYLEAIESELIRMPIGLILCVHTDLDSNNIQSSISSTMTTHYLAPNMVCEVDSWQKSQYGPKTEEMRTDMTPKQEEHIEQMIIRLNQRLGRMPTEDEVMKFIFGTKEERLSIWQRGRY